ncbi:MAG TPA: hypothetical protein VFU14_13915 [Acidimicrobiales bacterium]|nr:hypothetical protein [Acidimicrobiales bacterium]
MPAAADLTSADTDLIAACAAAIDVPKVAEPDSFVLHAPLELLARAILLPQVPEPFRPLVRRRLQWLADRYRAAGPDAPTQVDGALAPAVHDVLVSLAAAGHGPILLALRRRVEAVPPSFGDRLVASELARHPSWRLEWPSRRDPSGPASGDLEVRLAAPPSPGDPGSDFIYPTMHLVDASGLAAEVLERPLRGVSVTDARRTLLRVAARSMLQDAPAAAPYGWTHCLTMPQAVLDAVEQGADADLAVAVAATYVLGFRSTQGRVELDPAWAPAPGSAAHAVWAADDEELERIAAALAAYGAVHPDAHVAKYTLAGLDAAAADPDAARLFLAAVAHLHQWWRATATADDPILEEHLALEVADGLTTAPPS